jgi:hypothetical protein
MNRQKPPSQGTTTPRLGRVAASEDQAFARYESGPTLELLV